jgi:Glyoxalase-like domain
VSGLSLDHLVVAARTLDEGARWCEATLGIVPGPGGQHPLMSTHNRLFSMSSERFPKVFFEIIAIDPAATAPGRARWFGLDEIDLTHGPRLIHWVARCDSIDDELASLRSMGLDAGRAIAATRGDLRWRIAVRDDGRLLAHGACPTLIEWGGTPHPAPSMAASGVRLESLALRGLPAALALPSGVDHLHGPGPALEARLATPRGVVTITSSPPTSSP